MLGYVKTEKSSLKMCECKCYTGYYCGICKSIGRRYGQLPRMALSYDAAFLALLLAGLYSEENNSVRENCLAHPFRKKAILHNTAIDYAGDVMLIMAWYKLVDDIQDDGKIMARAAVRVMKNVFHKLQARYPVLCARIQDQMEKLSIMEEAKCASLDQVAEPFAQVMEAVLEEAPLPPGFNDQAALSKIGYHLGKWIYLIDAMDDLEDNIKTGAYNPLLYRFSYEKEEPDFRGRIAEICDYNLFRYLAEISKGVDQLPFKKNKSIIENIIYYGLHRKTEEQRHKEAP